MNKTANKAHVRWLIKRDMPTVLAIEASNYKHPWGEEDFLSALRVRNTIGMVCEVEERVRGFMLFELHTTRLHVLNLAVDVRTRRRGYGTSLIHKLYGKLRSHHRTRVTIDVADGNLSSHLFLRRLGMRATRVLRDGGGDSYRFEYELPHCGGEIDYGADS